MSMIGRRTNVRTVVQDCVNMVGRRINAEIAEQVFAGMANGRADVKNVLLNQVGYWPM